MPVDVVHSTVDLIYPIDLRLIPHHLRLQRYVGRYDFTTRWRMGPHCSIVDVDFVVGFCSFDFI